MHVHGGHKDEREKGRGRYSSYRHGDRAGRGASCQEEQRSSNPPGVDEPGQDLERLLHARRKDRIISDQSVQAVRADLHHPRVLDLIAPKGKGLEDVARVRDCHHHVLVAYSRKTWTKCTNIHQITKMATSQLVRSM